MEAGDSGKEPDAPEKDAPRKAEAKASEAKPAAKKPSSDEERRKMLRWGVIAAAVLVAVIAWVATSGDDDSGESEATAGFEAKVVSEAELQEIAGSAGHAVYWAGPIEGKELEASESESGGVQVRYLDEGAEPGSDSTGTLTIGSYPLADATKALEGFAERPGAIVRQSDVVGEVVSSPEAPSSAYFASPDGSVQIEVYDPSPARAMSLARSGKVQPVG
jgi:hypothetical protein